MSDNSNNSYFAEHGEFEDGKVLYAEDLNALRTNMQLGTGALATQQAPRSGDEHDNKVSQKEGETAPHFDFTGHPDAGEKRRIQYGAVGNYSVSLNGRSAALNKHATAIGNSTIALGEESFAQGYETIAEGNSSFAGGTRTWAQGKTTLTFGDRTVAKGDYSSAFGVNTIAEDNYQTVVGVANEIGDMAESLFEVGNGTLDEEGNVVTRSTAFRVMKEGKVKIKDIWAKEDDDVIALGFLNYRLNEEVLPELAKGINAELDKFRPYLVLTSDREDKTSAQLAACNASGAHSVAFGHTASATANYTSALGKNVSASEDYAIAMGVGSNATGEAAFAAGVSAIASGDHSRAFGTNVNAGYAYQTVIGKNNANKEGTLLEVGNGTDADHRSNAFEVHNNGLVVVGDKVQQMLDTNPVVFTGRNPNATALDATLNGSINTGATGQYSASFNGNTMALAKRSMAIGNKTIAKGEESLAGGYQSVTLGNGSFAFGDKNVTKGLNSQAMGVNTQAIGDVSHTIGNNTTASGYCSFATGNGCSAEGNCSFVGGWNTVAKAKYDFAHGAYLNTNSATQCQAVFGQYNVATQSALIIGNGADQNNRKNIFEVRQSGDICVYNEGKLYSLQALLKTIDPSIFTKVSPVNFNAEIEQ